MNRTEALALIQTIGLNRVMVLVGRDTNDDATGYAPALDRAFVAYIGLNALNTSVTTTVVADADVYGFQSLMRAVTYDLVLPELATMVDTNVDAPLTAAKFSQLFRSFSVLRDMAWKEAGTYGYGADINTGGFKTNLDFREPATNRGDREFG